MSSLLHIAAPCKQIGVSRSAWAAGAPLGDIKTSSSAVAEKPRCRVVSFEWLMADGMGKGNTLHQTSVPEN